MPSIWKISILVFGHAVKHTNTTIHSKKSVIWHEWLASLFLPPEIVPHFKPMHIFIRKWNDPIPGNWVKSHTHTVRFDSAVPSDIAAQSSSQFILRFTIIATAFFRNTTKRKKTKTIRPSRTIRAKWNTRIVPIEMWYLFRWILIENEAHKKPNFLRKMLKSVWPYLVNACV